MLAERVDGFNPLAVIEAYGRKKKLLLEGKGPALLDVVTYRFAGHSHLGQLVLPDEGGDRRLGGAGPDRRIPPPADRGRRGDRGGGATQIAERVKRTATCATFELSHPTESVSPRMRSGQEPRRTSPI